jgi:hypothetical protein
MRIAYGLESFCDLVVRTATHIIFIKARRLDRITAPIAEIEHECQSLISELRMVPASAQILLELWIYSKYGTYRFFRIGASGLTEIGRDGLPAPVPGHPADPGPQNRGPDTPGLLHGAHGSCGSG